VIPAANIPAKPPTQIRENYHLVLDQISEAAIHAGRRPEDIRLMVVTKGHPVEILLEAIEAGATFLGENYTEEAIPKIEAISGHPELEWHMIGHIQSRKASLVCRYFHQVHSLDSLKLARRLDQGIQGLNQGFPLTARKLPVLLECNVSGEESKFGFPAWHEESWPGLIKEIGEITRLPNLELRGLMTMAPFLPDAEDARPFFRQLRRLQVFLSAQFPNSNWNELSMGMSADYRVAIEEGATWVRIGTAILGQRR
jgi:PLP dependent protein